MTPPAVIVALRAAIADLRARPSEAPTERFAALLAKVIAVGAQASDHERHQLLEAVAALHAEASAALDRIGDELRQAGTSRVAMSGYGAIRPHTTAQRLRRRI